MQKPALDQLRIERKPEKESSNWPWLVGVLLLIVGALAAWFYWYSSIAVAEVRTEVARELKSQRAGTVLNASGYVTARRQATVSSKFTGKVTEVLIEEGMQVETGQVLARLDNSNVSASFELARAQLVSAQKGLKETETLLNEAQINFERSRRLVERELASEAELDRSRALAGSLNARLERKRADVEVAARQVDIYRQQMEDMIIRAPFAGVIVAKNAQPGEMISPVSAGGGFTRTGIGTIVDMNSLEIEIDVNEAYINRVAAGQKVMATLDAYPGWKIPCHVIAIIPTADRQRATVEVRVGFDELDSRILPDMGVKVAFQDSAQAGEDPDRRLAGVVLPQSAVRRADGRDYVLIVSDGLLERRAVALGDSRGSDAIITSGINPGESVVIKGPAELIDGMRVRERQE
jgi:RND family efflux transporter MFP subunit